MGAMTDREKDKLIVEALGECWHDERDPIYHNSQVGTSFRCTKCGCEFWGKDNHQSLATPEGFFWWWERMKKMECWLAFLRWYAQGDEMEFTQVGFLVDPTQGRDAIFRFFLAYPEWKHK